MTILCVFVTRGEKYASITGTQMTKILKFWSPQMTKCEHHQFDLIPGAASAISVYQLDLEFTFLASFTTAMHGPLVL